MEIHVVRSPEQVVLSTDSDICYICYEDKDLINSPCLCSMKIHVRCLKRLCKYRSQICTICRRPLLIHEDHEDHEDREDREDDYNEQQHRQQYRRNRRYESDRDRQMRLSYLRRRREYDEHISKIYNYLYILIKISVLFTLTILIGTVYIIICCGVGEWTFISSVLYGCVLMFLIICIFSLKNGRRR